jgi:hypothetical protein
MIPDSNGWQPTGLRPHIGGLFDGERVSIDFAGCSVETLDSGIQEPLNKII